MVTRARDVRDGVDVLGGRNSGVARPGAGDVERRLIGSKPVGVVGDDDGDLVACVAREYVRVEVRVVGDAAATANPHGGRVEGALDVGEGDVDVVSREGEETSDGSDGHDDLGLEGYHEEDFTPLHDSEIVRRKIVDIIGVGEIVRGGKRLAGVGCPGTRRRVLKLGRNSDSAGARRSARDRG